MIQQLTPEQDDALRDYASTWHHIWRLRPPEKSEVAEAIARVYKSARAETPPIMWCESPWQLSMMTAILSLHAITPGDTEFHNQLKSELNTPLWKRLWQRMDEQPIPSIFDKIDVGEGKSFNFETLAGTNLTGQITIEIASKATSVEESITDQLSLQTKLRLREIFRGTQDGGDERPGAERLPLIRGQFGFVSLGGLLGGDTVQRFLSPLSLDLQLRIRELCKEHLRSKPNPFAMFARADRLPEEELFSQLANNLSSPVSVQNLRHVAFVLKHLPVEVAPEVREAIVDWLTIKENVFHIDCMKNICFLCEPPTAATVNERNQLHNDSGAAMEFRDGFKLFAWGGVVIPPEAIEATQDISIERIDKEQNAEVRRILIQQYGLERYLQDSGARQIDADEFGVLYKKSLPNDEPVVVVKVTNRTPEPDGSRKFYFLRVPPYMTSARNAVAWTFNMSPEEYAPTIQT